MNQRALPTLALICIGFSPVAFRLLEINLPGSAGVTGQSYSAMTVNIGSEQLTSDQRTRLDRIKANQLAIQQRLSESQ